MRHSIAAPAALLLLAVAGTTRAQQPNKKDKAYTWSGQIPAGRWIHIEDINGSVTFEAASGDKVEVVASEEWNRGDPSLVHFDMEKGGAGGQDVTVCALWGTAKTCDQKGSGNNDHEKNNDVAVNFHVLVPKGVKIGGATVNGSIHLTGATAEVGLASVNGSVDLTAAGGPVKAITVNGSIAAHVRHVGPEDNITLTTVNGGVVADLPADLSADVDLSTVTGALKSDYDITVSGRIDSHHLAAHIGKAGGPKIKLTTVTGGIELRRR